jgi:hypothetical protein
MWADVEKQANEKRNKLQRGLQLRDCYENPNIPYQDYP